MRRVGPLVIALFLGIASFRADLAAQAGPISIESYAVHIAEASRRFGVPERWIEVILRAESGGEVRALSPAGAMGLMQLMPATWRELRHRHGLGPDVYEPRDNILAGTAYIAELHARFGAPGFLAAYNAGPSRYAEYLASGRPLPAETRAYIARLAPMISAGASGAPRSRHSKSSSSWHGAPLFFARPDVASSAQPLPFPDTNHNTLFCVEGALTVPRQRRTAALRCAQCGPPEHYHGKAKCWQD